MLLLAVDARTTFFLHLYSVSYIACNAAKAGERNMTLLATRKLVRKADQGYKIANTVSEIILIIIL